jgi:hypothetical protein
VASLSSSGKPAPIVFSCRCIKKRIRASRCPSMLRLDYISCGLTVISTLLVGRKLWQGWIIAGANSALICLIGIRTAQFGFVPANLFCIALYSYNVRSWKR